MRFRQAAVLAVAALVGCGGVDPARAQNGDFHEIETKYIFGFTTGSSIGLEGEKEVSIDTVVRLGKRTGRYAASETKLEFEHTPTQFVQLEFGALVAAHAMRHVSDLDNRDAVNFGGLFGEFRYLVIGRGPSSPFGLTLSVEPAWRRVDETSGDRIGNLELETKVAVDTELVENRLYLGVNASYEPEWTRTRAGGWEKESKLGLSTAVSFRPAPPLLFGAELGYFRHYDGIGLRAFTGDAVFLGPTLYLQLVRKAFLTAAWATQIVGRDFENPGSRNLSEFSRHRARLKVALEF
ncbi:MAG: hypothetical protein HY056_16510 [Proteobacteria bacterium]|nr:hypothetical protein [Pseudomonadota bacterium]